jgi:uncharacterized membrane protein YfcA
MNPDHVIYITLLIGAVAFLYSSVGHAGASGYIAVLSLFSVAPAVIKPSALVLNIAVASIGAWQFWKAGHFSWRLFWPFALPAVPMAFLGGYLHLPAHAFKILVGLILLASALRFLFKPQDDSAVHPPSHLAALPTGAGLGLLSGLTGTGGGIFLTPLLLFMRWTHTKTAAAVSALFILVNSIAGLLGNISGTRSFPSFALAFVVAAVLGGTAGSYLGSRRFDPILIKRLLAVVLLIAGIKLLFVA